MSCIAPEGVCLQKIPVTHPSPSNRRLQTSPPLSLHRGGTAGLITKHKFLVPNEWKEANGSITGNHVFPKFFWEPQLLEVEEPGTAWSPGYIFTSGFWPFHTTISTTGAQQVQAAFTLLDLQLLAYWRYEELRSNFIYCCCHCWQFPALQDICCDSMEPPPLKDIYFKSPRCWRIAVTQCACLDFNIYVIIFCWLF